MSEDNQDKFTLKSELDRLHKAEPFVHFEIVVSSGDSLFVSNAVELVVGADLLHLVHSKSETTEMIRLNQIVMIRINPEVIYGSRDSEKKSD